MNPEGYGARVEECLSLVVELFEYFDRIHLYFRILHLSQTREKI